MRQSKKREPVQKFLSQTINNQLLITIQPITIQPITKLCGSVTATRGPHKPELWVRIPASQQNFDRAGMMPFFIKGLVLKTDRLALIRQIEKVELN